MSSASENYVPVDEMELAEALAELHDEHKESSCGQSNCEVCNADLADAVDLAVDQFVNGDDDE